MSDASRDRKGVFVAGDIETRAAAWLEKQACGDWQAEDQMRLDGWLAESPAHEVAFARLESAWRQADRLSVLRRTAPAPTSQSEKRFVRRWSKVLSFAALAVLAGISALYFVSHQATKTYSTGLGSHRTIVFADGSQVELNTDTTIRAAIDGKQRRIWLEKGEAYFVIKHDVLHPLAVIAGAGQVVDLGTKFLVRRDENRVAVTLMEGRVRFDSFGGGKNAAHLALKVGDRLVANGGSVAVTKQSVHAQEDELAWRRGLLIFDRTTLAAAASEFNRYSKKKIVLENPSVARMTIGGTFRTSNIEQFVGVAQDVLGLHASVRGDTTIISR